MTRVHKKAGSINKYHRLLATGSFLMEIFIMMESDKLLFVFLYIFTNQKSTKVEQNVSVRSSQNFHVKVLIVGYTRLLLKDEAHLYQSISP